MAEAGTIETAAPAASTGGAGIRFLLGSLALQNLGRRKARTLLLLAAVAICSGAVFTGAVLMRSIETSMAVGFTRLGADMLVVPAGTLTNITAALLTAEPTDLTLDASMLDRLSQPQGRAEGGAAIDLSHRCARATGTATKSVDLIAFDPARDITVQPWLEQHLDRPLRKGDVIVGGRREEPLGSELLLFGEPLTVYGKLGKTAVGTHERGLFITLRDPGRAARRPCSRSAARKAPLEPNKLSGVLLELAPGATTQQVRFAILANFPGVKVVAGESMLTSIRQGLAALLDGVLALMVVMFVSTGADGQRPVLGDHHRAAPRARPAQGDRRAPRPDHRHAADRSRAGDRRRRAHGLRAGRAADARLRAFPGLLSRQHRHSLRLAGHGHDGPHRAGLHSARRPDRRGWARSIPAWRASRREPYDLIRSEG